MWSFWHLESVGNPSSYPLKKTVHEFKYEKDLESSSPLPDHVIKNVIVESGKMLEILTVLVVTVNEIFLKLAHEQENICTRKHTAVKKKNLLTLTSSLRWCEQEEWRLVFSATLLSPACVCLGRDVCSWVCCRLFGKVECLCFLCLDYLTLFQEKTGYTVFVEKWEAASWHHELTHSKIHTQTGFQPTLHTLFIKRWHSVGHGKFLAVMCDVGVKSLRVRTSE